MSEKVECFCCGIEIKAAACNTSPWEMPQGVSFIGGENFGSRAFDSMVDDGLAQLVICDDCFIKNKRRARKIKVINTQTIKQLPW